MEREAKLSKFRVGSLPTLYYIPNFITDDEHAQLLKNIYQAPVSKWKSLKNRRLQNWGGVVHEKGLLSQDLPAWLTKLTKRIFEESELFPSAINHVLINEYLPTQGIMPHQDGPAYFPVVAILSLGSPAVMDFTPHSRLKLCSNSSYNVEESNPIGVGTEIETDKWLDNHHPFSVLLMPSSLLIFKDDAYSDYLHGIKDTEVQRYEKAINVNEASEKAVEEMNNGHVLEVMNDGDVKNIHRTTNRISLTCRLVLKVHTNLFKF